MDLGLNAAGLCLVSQVTAADTRAIEAGLEELWRLAEAGQIGGSIVRAASMTMIVPIGEDADADQVIGVLDGLTETHPCRAILVESDGRTNEPRARLCSHCRRIVEAETTRYWEEIRLVSPAPALHQVMGTVATLALPNLPIQAWWPGEPQFDGDLYNHLVEVSDRLVVDSSRFHHPAVSLPGLASAINVAHESVAFGDLSWTRLTPWRLLTAEFFDAPEDQALLDSIERVRIEYVLEAGGEMAQALLMVGWLASRLGWEPRQLSTAGPGAWSFELVDGVRPVRVEIVRRETTGDASDAESSPGLRALTIDAAEAGRQASYTIERCGDEEARTVKLKGDGARLEGRAYLPVQDEVELLQEELSEFATDRIYQESVSLVVRIFEGHPQ